jgi:hypothetical protein
LKMLVQHPRITNEAHLIRILNVIYVDSCAAPGALHLRLLMLDLVPFCSIHTCRPEKKIRL